ncbi:hypothetical protein BXT84_06280 [Sulfobacillus thermotolerans]|uniref:Uncharacterized protein n=1 Tax=Sulfobacillus thermotolerans TaxID=338644 RepID=A0ABN5GYK1_9FIRM|nr:hypothetical protein BXT84_00740 [Sulfobacillus thermotolerans]AUW93597.1 hypothetical protein BXT84_06280 [Sulfobacillus thermotolerans]
MRTVKQMTCYRVQPLRQFPGVMVWTPEHQRADRVQDFLEFAVSQGRPLRRVRRTGRILAEAATWIYYTHTDWSAMTLARWGDYLTTIVAAGPPMDAARLFPVVDALYEFYAFWWWIDPPFLPYQPWPQQERRRHQWVQHWWSYRAHIQDFPGDFLDPLPF